MTPPRSRCAGPACCEHHLKTPEDARTRVYTPWHPPTNQRGGRAGPHEFSVPHQGCLLNDVCILLNSLSRVNRSASRQLGWEWDNGREVSPRTLSPGRGTHTPKIFCQNWTTEFPCSPPPTRAVVCADVSLCLLRHDECFRYVVTTEKSPRSTVNAQLFSITKPITSLP